jgi:hypothetical protein
MPRDAKLGVEESEIIGLRPMMDVGVRVVKIDIRINDHGGAPNFSR